MVALSGGQKLEDYLANLSKKYSTASSVSIGFLSGSSYPDGTPVAMVAAIQNWGAPSRGIPPRPFFTNMIAAKSPEWGPALAKNLAITGGDAEKALGRVGLGIKGQLQTSIIETNSPPLAASTIKRKGFDKPLVDTGTMLNGVDFRVN